MLEEGDIEEMGIVLKYRRLTFQQLHTVVGRTDGRDKTSLEMPSAQKGQPTALRLLSLLAWVAQLHQKPD